MQQEFNVRSSSGIEILIVLPIYSDLDIGFYKKLNQESRHKAKKL